MCIQNTHKINEYSVDETMIPFKGRTAGNLCQYMKAKPIKFGFKSFQLASRDGLICAFVIYQGSSTFTILEDTEMHLTEEEMKSGIGASAVLALCKIIKKPRVITLFCDNYFSSIKLFLYLRSELGIFATGTFRSDRIDHCPLKSDKDLEKDGRFSFDYRSTDNKAILIKFFYNKCVILGSCMYGIELKGKISRWVDKKKVSDKAPAVVNKYNEEMGGVDLSNRYVALYRTDTRSERWYLRIFDYLLELCMSNA